MTDDLRTFTLADVQSWGPCRTYRDRLADLAREANAGPGPWTPLEALDLLRDRLPYKDLIWLLTHALAHLHPGRLIWWAADCADRAHGPTEATRVARGVVRGTHTREAAGAAGAAAAAASAWAAASASAWASVWTSAAARAVAAVARVAWAEAVEAAEVAVTAAGWAAERAWQLDRLRTLLLTPWEEVA